MRRREIIPVILCGGNGTRLWPRSRATSPKPFLPLIGDETLFQQALKRVAGEPFGDPIIVTGGAHVDLVEQQLDDVRIREIIVENEPKNTAAAAALAAARVDPGAVILILSSDHHVEDAAAFRRAAIQAAALAEEQWLVCLGVPASRPETRFGYVRRGEPLAGGGFRVSKFVEKPTRAKAEEFLKSGDFAWNAGIFAFRAGCYLDELRAHRPSIAGATVEAVRDGKLIGNHFHPDVSTFSSIPAESLDRAVMENTDRAAVVMLETGWSDIGNWQALHRARSKDEAGNSVRGPAELVECRNVFVDSDGPTVHAFGLQDLIVVVDGDEILIASSAGDLARLVAARSR